MLLKAVTCLQSPAADPPLDFIFAGENQWRPQSNFKCISAQNRAAQQQVSIQFQQLIFPWIWGKSLGGLRCTNGSWKWSVLLRAWKKSAENIPVSVYVLNVAWASFNFSWHLEIRTVGNFFFLKLGWYLDILSVLMFIFSFLVSYCLYKEYWAQEITTTEENSEFILAGCFVFPGKNTSVMLVGAARPLQWPLPILCLCGQELWGRWVSIWLHFFPSDSLWDPRAAPSWLLLAEHTMAGLRCQRCVRECDRGMSLSPQPCSLCHTAGNSLHSTAQFSQIHSLAVIIKRWPFLHLSQIIFDFLVWTLLSC